MATIKVGGSPLQVAADARTGTVWVTCLGSVSGAPDNFVNEISEAIGKVVATIPVGNTPSGIAADPRTGTVWVANTFSGTVSEISESGRNVIGTISTAGTPAWIAVDQATGHVWVAMLALKVDEISQATKKVIGHLTINLKPAAAPSFMGIGFDPSTPAVWVASHWDSRDDAGDSWNYVSNGIGTAKGQYTLTQHLVIKVT